MSAPPPVGDPSRGCPVADAGVRSRPAGDGSLPAVYAGPARPNRRIPERSAEAGRGVHRIRCGASALVHSRGDRPRSPQKVRPPAASCRGPGSPMDVSAQVPRAGCCAAEVAGCPAASGAGRAAGAAGRGRRGPPALGVAARSRAARWSPASRPRRPVRARAPRRRPGGRRPAPPVLAAGSGRGGVRRPGRRARGRRGRPPGGLPHDLRAGGARSATPVTGCAPATVLGCLSAAPAATACPPPACTGGCGSGRGLPRPAGLLGAGRVRLLPVWGPAPALDSASVWLCGRGRRPRPADGAQPRRRRARHQPAPRQADRLVSRGRAAAPCWPDRRDAGLAGGHGGRGLGRSVRPAQIRDGRSAASRR